MIKTGLNKTDMVLPVIEFTGLLGVGWQAQIVNKILNKRDMKQADIRIMICEKHLKENKTLLR